MGTDRALKKAACVGRTCGLVAHGAAGVRLISLLFVSGLTVAGCASMLPAPPRPAVKLTVTRATTYYSLRGTTTADIFKEIEAHALRDQDGGRAAGLTAAKSEMTWKGRETGALCTPESATITLGLVVTLPQHDHPHELSKDLQERWQHFAAAVAAHEQRHVDIFMSRANVVKAHIEAALKNWASCADVEAAIRSIWASHEAETKDAQREFDAEDRVRILNDRTPLQAEIDTRKARLTALATETRELEATLAELARRAGAERAKIDLVKADIAQGNGNCTRPTERIERLCRQFNTLVTTHNAVVAEHSSVVAHRNKLADEHNVLVETINALTETLNWVQ